ncbi:DUF3857 domain-containing protein [Fibrella aquatilis]|uniref:DUF3857 domain-containing protein n=1 Tax=Fibrella aquatilis TaxID=2817059 RepID=A0A939G3G7_9BACT|nr:DUF3857 domain-containing protein [Fibrella aquatilis]MBO0930508.1 DUF3857 domain-containing protein [Fibrella aquatilis]
MTTLPSLYLGCVISLLPLFCWAQTTTPTPNVKFGQVTEADFALKPVPNDTTAEAVVLYESADSRFEFRNNRIQLITSFFSRIRINKKSGYDQATVDIPLRGKSTDADYAMSLEGVTYTLQNGQVTKQKMDKAAIRIENVADGYRIQKFTLPGVQEGCIIEYRYVLNMPNVYTPPSWRFQQSIPVVWSDYKVTIPNFFYHKVILTGYLPLTVYQSRTVSSQMSIPGIPDVNATESHYAMANAPAFRNEPYITTAGDYVSKIEFELARVDVPGQLTENYSLNWPDIDQTLLRRESFGGQYKKAPYFRDVATAIKAKYPATDTLGRAVAAYEHVRSTMTWNEKTSMDSDRLKKVLELKKGDVADLNFMLIGLLRDLDIDANPLILSTRDHGRINETYGLLRKFNYVVAHLVVGGKDMMLDATDRFVKPGMLPERALNSTGRLIMPNDQSRFVSLTPTERDVEAKSASFTLSDEGELTGELTHSYAGYAAVDARSSYVLRGETLFVEDVKRKKPSWQIEKAEFTNATNVNLPLSVKYALKIPEAAQVAGDRIYLNPLLTEGSTENPFK